MTDDIQPAMTPEQWEARPEKIRTSVRALHGTDALHPVAAACLYGQPFGFTHEDVEILRLASRNADASDFNGSAADPLMELADKIAALLPPQP